MNKSMLGGFSLAMVLALSACATLEPELPAADAAVPGAWHTGAAGAAPAPQRPVAEIGWRDFFVDQKLQQLIARALENNRDLRVALLNVERAQALYRVQRADRFPSVSAGLANVRGGPAPVNEGYTASLGMAAFEIDLFGRVHNLSAAAVQQYLAQEQASRSAQLSLAAEVANVYLTLGADLAAQRVAQATLENQQASYELIVKRHSLGAVSGLELAQARTTVESARADAAGYAGLVAADTNALTLLVGAPVEAALLPDGLEPASASLAGLPPELPSEVLLQRPDIRQAEHLLRSANANIGAARAAFFPSISLTGSIGSYSNDLDGLFGSGTRIWSFVPQINLPIFQGGRLQANLEASRSARDIALAQYEKAIQAGFREVADALSLSVSLKERREAQQALLDAADRAHQLSRARFDSGHDSFLVLLDAQRNLYAAQQALIAVQQAEFANRVNLYKALGGGWQEHSS